MCVCVCDIHGGSHLTVNPTPISADSLHDLLGMENDPGDDSPPPSLAVSAESMFPSRRNGSPRSSRLNGGEWIQKTHQTILPLCRCCWLVYLRHHCRKVDFKWFRDSEKALQYAEWHGQVRPGMAKLGYPVFKEQLETGPSTKAYGVGPLTRKLNS